MRRAGDCHPRHGHERTRARRPGRLSSSTRATSMRSSTGCTRWRSAPENFGDAKDFGRCDDHVRRAVRIGRPRQAPAGVGRALSTDGPTSKVFLPRRSRRSAGVAVPDAFGEWFGPKSHRSFSRQPAQPGHRRAIRSRRCEVRGTVVRDPGSVCRPGIGDDGSSTTRQQRPHRARRRQQPRRNSSAPARNRAPALADQDSWIDRVLAALASCASTKSPTIQVSSEYTKRSMLEAGISASKLKFFALPRTSASIRPARACGG